MPDGRPPLFSTPEEMKLKGAEYFVKDNEPFTITGLALYLGFCDRQSLYDYEKRDGFSCIVKEMRLKVENSYEQRLYTNAVTGAIFALKNMGWKDKTEVESSGQLGITWKEEKTYAPEPKTN